MPRNSRREADDASVLGGEGRGGAAGASAPRGAGHRSRDGAAGRSTARLRGRVGAEVGAPGRHRRRVCARGRRTAEAHGSRRSSRRTGSCARGERDPAVGVGFLRGGARPPTEVIVRLHRRASRRVRSRAHLHGVAGGSEHVLRGEVPAASARAVPRRGDDPDPDRDLGGELPGLRGPQALEGGTPCRPRHRPGPGRPADAPGGDRGVRRRRRVRTTRPDPAARRPADLVDADFTASDRTSCGSPT